MIKQEAQKLKHSIYRIYWKDGQFGDTSVGVVGSKYDGSRRLCCSNWTSPAERGTYSFADETWDAVLKMELIATK